MFQVAEGTFPSDNNVTALLNLRTKAEDIKPKKMAIEQLAQVLRHDGQYLLVGRCPEVSRGLLEFLRKYFREHDDVSFTKAIKQSRDDMFPITGPGGTGNQRAVLVNELALKAIEKNQMSRLRTLSNKPTEKGNERKAHASSKGCMSKFNTRKRKIIEKQETPVKFAILTNTVK